MEVDGLVELFLMIWLCVIPVIGFVWMIAVTCLLISIARTLKKIANSN